MSETILQIRDLNLSLRAGGRWLRVVRGVDLALQPRATHGLVGESGCGKTVTALSILRLLPRSLARYDAGSIMYGGRDLLTLPERELQKLRGDRIAYVFQEPSSSLNPVLSIGRQVGEPLQIHRGLKGAALAARVEELLLAVGIAEPQRRRAQYPHELSGGLRQRALIAAALACDPEILIADEPTSALDATVQAQILALLAELQRQRGLTLLLISHDLGLIAQQAQTVSVMYAGEIVESAPSRELLSAPRHPYTQALLRALPAPGARKEARGLPSLPGAVAAPEEAVPGCAFHPRCPIARPQCRTQAPALEELRPGHRVRCPYADKT